MRDKLKNRPTIRITEIKLVLFQDGVVIGEDKYDPHLTLEPGYDGVEITYKNTFSRPNMTNHIAKVEKMELVP